MFEADPEKSREEKKAENWGKKETWLRYFAENVNVEYFHRVIQETPPAPLWPSTLI